MEVHFGRYPKDTSFSLLIRDHFKDTNSALICILPWVLDSVWA